MGKYASEVVKVALSWLGKKESDGSHKEIIDVYNSQKSLPRGYRLKYNDPWCAGFVSAVAIKLDYTDIIPVEVSCYYMIEKAKSMGIWNESDGRTPNVGDLLLYDWNDNGNGDNKGTPDHIGIVTSVNPNTKTFIVTEGNRSNAVKSIPMGVNARYIRGYITPLYNKEETATTTQNPTTTNSKKSNIEVAKEVVNGLWGNGSERRERLTKAGYNYSEVQKAVNKLLSKGSNPSENTSKPSESLEAVARDVIRGKWGNGSERKKRLTEAGYNYNEIQKIVNKLLK